MRPPAPKRPTPQECKKKEFARLFRREMMEETETRAGIPSPTRVANIVRPSRASRLERAHQSESRSAESGNSGYYLPRGGHP
jgi:hypothetical protein